MGRLVVLLAVALLVLVGCDPPPLASPGSGGSDVADVVDPSVVGTPQGSFVSEDWHPVGGAGEPAFQNSWVDGAETVAFRLRESGIVDIKGSVTGGTPGSTIFTLPEGYRPVLASSYVVFGQIGGVPSVGLLTIETSGNVHGERFSATDHDAMYITGSFFLNVV